MPYRRLIIPLLILIFPLLTVWYAGSTPFEIEDSKQKHYHSEPKEKSLPLFAKNKGQWHRNVKYKTKMSNSHFFWEKDRLTVLSYHPEDIDIYSSCSHGEATYSEQEIRAHAFQIVFDGANSNVEITSSGESTAYENYFIGNDPNKWATQVRKYEIITYTSIYEGIDLLVGYVAGHPKYDFIVKAGADPDQIGIDYTYVDNLYIKEESLFFETSVGSFTESLPEVYQIIDNQRISVECKYVLDNNHVSYALGDYNPDFDLVIDPELVFASYSGSFSDNWGFTATYDSNGNSYGGGIVFGGGYPTTFGAFQTSFEGGQTDIGITKFNRTGSDVIYATYIGGSSLDVPHSMIVNSKGELVIYGTTSSFDFPISGGYDNTFNGGQFAAANSLSYSNGADIAVVVLSADGSSLTGSTYLGGTRNDGLNLTLAINYGDGNRGEVIVDKDDNIIIGSTTNSTDFPTPNGFNSTYSGGQSDAVLAKLSPTASSLLWSTYVGGSSDDAGYTVKVDSDDNLYMAGGTRSNNFPTTPGVLNQTYQGGSKDGFILKTSGNGIQILASSFIGTSNEEQVYFIDLNENDELFAVGQIVGSYPISPDVYADPNSGQFVHKMKNTLDSTFFSTQFGKGSGQIEISINGFSVDKCDRIYISGWGGETNLGHQLIFGMPTTDDAIQTSTDGSDFYFFVFEKDAKDVEFASYYGGLASREHVDGGTSRFDSKGILYQAVCAGCGGNSSFPATNGAYSETNNSSNCNMAVIKLDFQLLEIIAKAEAQASADTIGCIPFTIPFNNYSIGDISGFHWDFGDGHQSTETFPEHTYQDTGLFEVTMIAYADNECIENDTDIVYVRVIENSVGSLFYGSICNQENTTLTSSLANENFQYFWQDGSNSPTLDVSQPGFYWVRTEFGSCFRTDTFIIDQVSIDLDIGPDLEICNGSATIDGLQEDVEAYLWNDGSTEPSLEISEQGYYWLEILKDGCRTRDSMFLTLHAYDEIDLGPDTVVCENEIHYLNADIGADTYLWHDGSTDSVFAVETPGLKWVTATIGNCESTDSITIAHKSIGCYCHYYIPNAFTPNGDLINDGFRMEHKYCKIEDFIMQIFDRWGNMLFETHDQYAYWDGTFKGKKLKPGVFVYSIRFRFTGSEKWQLEKGDVTLLQ